MIVDDDNRNIFELKAVLKSKGYECVAATSAKEGIKHLKTDDAINIVLMDMMMPDMDGYEAIEYIKRDDQISKIPIISVTAQAMVGDREKCLSAGANDYISKPVNIDALVGILNKHIDEK